MKALILFRALLPFITAAGVGITAATADDTAVKSTVFNSVMSADGSYVSGGVRDRAARELQAFLRGVKLSEQERASLNAQLSDVGIEVLPDSTVVAVSGERLAQIRAEKREKSQKALVLLMSENRRRFTEEWPGFTDTDWEGEDLSLFASLSGRAGDDYEEEEEEELSVQEKRELRKQRIALRQKLLGTYILSSLDSSLRLSMQFRGKRPLGSAYLQGLMKKYETR